MFANAFHITMLSCFCFSIFILLFLLLLLSLSPLMMICQLSSNCKMDCLDIALTPTFSPWPQRIPLDFLQGNRFMEAAENYIRPLLTKVFKFLSYAALIDLPSLDSKLQMFLLCLGSSIIVL
jgi:hypothetical protein